MKKDLQKKGDGLFIYFSKKECKHYGYDCGDILDISDSILTKQIIVDENISNIMAKSKQDKEIKKINKINMIITKEQIKLEFIYCLIEQDYALSQKKYQWVLDGILSQSLGKTQEVEE